MNSMSRALAVAVFAVLAAPLAAVAQALPKPVCFAWNGDETAPAPRRICVERMDNSFTSISGLPARTIMISMDGQRRQVVAAQTDNPQGSLPYVYWDATLSDVTKNVFLSCGGEMRARVELRVPLGDEALRTADLAAFVSEERDTCHMPGSWSDETRVLYLRE